MTSTVDTGAAAPCPAPFNLSAHVLERAAATPDKAALELVGPDGKEIWSFGRLEEMVRRLAGGFIARGLQPGDRVLMRLGNVVEFPMCYLAAIAAGLVAVPTSAQLTRPEITAIASAIRPALIVAAADVALPDGTDAPVLGIDGLHALAGAEPAEWHLGDPDRLAYVIFTSGTSGRPQPVAHAHRAIWARRMMHHGWYGLRSDDRLLHAGAFNWTFTLGTGLLDPWSVGATALIPAPGTGPTDLPALLASHRATLFAGAPGVYRQMLRAPIPAMPSLRHGLSAGEAMPHAVRAAWMRETGTPVHEAFGMSECSTFVSGSPARPAPDDTLGYPQPGRRVAIIGEDGAPVARAEPGTISIGANDPGLMLGYLDLAAETRARFTDDGAWFLTGDLGTMDETGAIAYLGRADDMMNAGGFRVSPIEVEAAMQAHKAIHEAAAVERATASGARIIALHYTAAGPLDTAELTAFAAARLARYKCPRLFIHMPALPRGANNKLLRRALREKDPPDGQA